MRAKNVVMPQGKLNIAGWSKVAEMTPRVQSGDRWGAGGGRVMLEAYGIVFTHPHRHTPHLTMTAGQTSMSLFAASSTPYATCP
jgi:hypothetical protein